MKFLAEFDTPIAKRLGWVELLAKLGCYQKFVGVQSFDRRTLVIAKLDAARHRKPLGCNSSPKRQRYQLSNNIQYLEDTDMLQTILIVLVILFLLGGVGTLPRWSHSRNWGYGPSGGSSLLGIILLVLQILMLMGRLKQRLKAFAHGISSMARNF